MDNRKPVKPAWGDSGEKPPLPPSEVIGMDTCESAHTPEKTKEESDTWNDFVENTTFHGVRYVFGGTSSWMRK